jgi:hypothetical protein
MADHVINPTPNSTPEIQCAKSQKEISKWRKVYNVLTWTPPNCRWDPAKPPQFSMSMSSYHPKYPIKKIDPFKFGISV